MRKYRIRKYLVFIALIFLCFSSCQQRVQSVNFAKNNLYPWCIVAYDSCNRAPEARIQMIKELGFVNYAYDWRERHLSSTLKELKLAEKNGVKVQSVWLWLNAKNDSLANLSSANEKLISIVEKSGKLS